MKKLSLFFLFLFSFILHGCNEGDAYIQWDWTYTPQGATTNDPAFVSTIYRGRDNKATPGTYDWTIINNNGTTYSGTYTLYQIEGGALKSGEDIYFEFYINKASAPSLFTWDTSRVVQNSNSSDTEKRQAQDMGITIVNSLKNESSIPLTRPTTYDYHQEQRVGNYLLELNYNRY